MFWQTNGFSRYSIKATFPSSSPTTPGMQSVSIGGKGAHSGARCSLQLDGHLNVRPRCCVEARQLPFEANPQFAFPDKCQMKPEGLEIECSLQARSTIPSKRRLDRSVRIPALNVIIQSLVRDWYSIYAPSFKHSARVLRPDLPRSSKGAVNCSLGRAPGNDDHNQHQSHQGARLNSSNGFSSLV
jgi:hypothetical protein